MMVLPNSAFAQKPIFTKLAEDITICDAFAVIEQEFGNCFLMESLDTDLSAPRYSLIGFDPAHIIAGRGNSLIIDGVSQTVSNPYESLRGLMPSPVSSDRYAGGLVGYVSYEAANYFEPSLSLKTHPVFDQFKFGMYTDGIVIDTLTNEWFYFTHGEDRSQDIQRLLRQKPTSPKPARVTFLRDTLSRDEHRAAVSSVKEDILAGNIFQCEVGFKAEFQLQGDAFSIYRKLRTVNPSPYMYYVKFGGQKIIGASPELLFSLNQDMMTTRPLAGTAKRGKTNTEDIQLARKLLNNPKEIAEHNMIVDLHRNDIGRVAQFGSVRINGLKYIKRFSHVQHIETEITGIINQNEDMFSAFAANFPAGTLSGAPKLEAMRIIDRNEPEARGPYGGGVGYFGFNGDCSFSIAIRSLFINGDYAYSQTCSGIVHDSDASKEYLEIQHKFAAMKETLGL